MNKLAKKFIIGIVIILFLSTLLSATIHNVFVEKYYLHQKRESLNQICTSLIDILNQGVNIDEAILQIENNHKVLIVYTDHTTFDNDILNDKIRHAFQEKGVGFQTYWLWENDYQVVVNGQQMIRLYQQEKLNYSLLVDYISYGDILISTAMIIPNISDAFSIVLTFSLAISICTIIAAIFVIILLVKNITSPLKQFQIFAANMSKHEFLPLHIHTKDELEDVATQLNDMGNQIITYQASLERKNKQMEQLLDDVAHDLKTPVSLIKLYANGIQDGLDDGTFLETIIHENNQLDKMIHQLLFLSKIDKEQITYTSCNISKLLHNLLKKYDILANDQHLTFRKDIEQDIYIQTDEKALATIWTNIITNAIKYTSSPQINIQLRTKNASIIFMISNYYQNESLDITKIWSPYYVGESSRNKHLSGTGMGLSIVKKIVSHLQYDIACYIQENQIFFTLTIPSSHKNNEEHPEQMD